MQFKVGDRVRCGKHEGVIDQVTNPLQARVMFDHYLAKIPTFLLEKIQPERKVGDKVWIEGEITKVDDSDFPYRISIEKTGLGDYELWMCDELLQQWEDKLEQKHGKQGDEI